VIAAVRAGGQTTYNRSPRCQRLPLDGFILKHLTRFFAFFVFSILAGSGFAGLHSQLTLSKFGLFPVPMRMESGDRGVGRWSDLRHAGQLAIAMIIGIPSVSASRVSNRAVSGMAQVRSHGHRNAGGIRASSRHVGCCVRPLFAEYVQPVLIETFGALPFSACCSRTAMASAC